MDAENMYAERMDEVKYEISHFTSVVGNESSSLSLHIFF